MKTSPNGRQMIEASEGFDAASYKDQRNIWTIGFGHTTGVVAGMTCTREQADAWMAEDLATAEYAVNSSVNVPLNQNRFDALVSLAYNIGAGAFEKSTLVKLLNERDYIGAENQFLVWCRTNGKVNPGLLARRQREMKLFGDPA